MSVRSYPHSIQRIGSLLAGRFYVERQLGVGGMSAVYAATDTQSGERVALKWMSVPEGTSDRVRAQTIERLLREARACSRIDHPNVLRVHDVVEDGEELVLVMELLKGESLAAVLERGTMPLDRFITMLMAAMYGVAEAHRCGIIHRDIKPENIFLERQPASEPRVKVIDFGISKQLDQRGHSLTSGRALLGTPVFMSPEQLSSPRSIDERADVWAFGVILYRAVTGRFPYVAESVPQLVQQMSMPLVSARTLNPALPLALDRLITWSLARDRAQRLESVPAFIKGLVPFAYERGLREQMHAGAAPLTVRRAQSSDDGFERAAPSVPAPTRHEDGRVRSIVGTLLAIAACIALVLLWRSHTTPQPTAKVHTPRREVGTSAPVVRHADAPRPRR